MPVKMLREYSFPYGLNNALVESVYSSSFRCIYGVRPFKNTGTLLEVLSEIEGNDRFLIRSFFDKEEYCINFDESTSQKVAVECLLWDEPKKFTLKELMETFYSPHIIYLGEAMNMREHPLKLFVGTMDDILKGTMKEMEEDGRS